MLAGLQIKCSKNVVFNQSKPLIPVDFSGSELSMLFPLRQDGFKSAWLWLVSIPTVQ